MAIWHYFKFSLFYFVSLGALTALLAGGQWISFGLLAITVLYIVGDAWGGDDASSPSYRHPFILTLLLWLALPLLLAIVAASIWGVSDSDLFGFGAWASQLSGYDLLAARAATTWPQHFAALVLTGLLIGLVGTISAHELCHRTWDPISRTIARCLLAFSFDTIFSIEHVYGHHRYVATTDDPATAPRGRHVYAHIFISTLKGNRSAWQLERARLQKKQLALWSWHNRFISGHLHSVALLILITMVAGIKACLFFIACALWGKALLEIVNYMEHYGLVRDPATSVQPRHSWNSNRRLSSWTMFNLTRHSHHHAHSAVPYHKLQAYPDAPHMIGGYLSTIIIAMIPPLWHYLMVPKLKLWDAQFASEKERELARVANQRSGLAALMRDAK